MRIVVSGASGLIGTALIAHLRSAGHDVRTLVRRPPGSPAEIRWDPAAVSLDPDALTGVQAAINLSGAGIGDRRWTEKYRRLVVDSRTGSTTLLASTLAKLDPLPDVLLSGSAIGYYGDCGDEQITESSPAGTGFLANVCVQWEASTAAAASAGIRVCHLRTGLVLSRGGGLLGKLLPLYRLGLGGPLGSGRQWQSWITLDDEVAAIAFLLTAQIAGPVNLTAPGPVRQRDLARALGRAVRRPALLPAPAPALRIAVGGFADEGILASQRALPTVLTDAGFAFGATDIDEGLRVALR
jgi:uncharacterized protein (TIGR01777 family)